MLPEEHFEDQEKLLGEGQEQYPQGQKQLVVSTGAEEATEWAGAVTVGMEAVTTVTGAVTTGAEEATERAGEATEEVGTFMILFVVFSMLSSRKVTLHLPVEILEL